MKFKALRISDWKQFQNIDIDFHERLTILTGANGSGKTTLLHLSTQNIHLLKEGITVLHMS